MAGGLLGLDPRLGVTPDLAVLGEPLVSYS